MRVKTHQGIDRLATTLLEDKQQGEVLIQEREEQKEEVEVQLQEKGKQYESLTLEK